jgi:uncharacterized protein (DUF934 family)
MARDIGTSPDEVQFRFRDDEPVDHAAVTVDSVLDQTNATAVRIEPGDDARVLLPFLDRLALVEVNFPVFGDGRGYSAARILREAGYTGELRAVGAVLIDQLDLTKLNIAVREGYVEQDALDALNNYAKNGASAPTPTAPPKLPTNVDWNSIAGWL